MKERFILKLKYIMKFGFFKGLALFAKNRIGKQKKINNITILRGTASMAIRKNSTDVLTFEKIFVFEEYGFDIKKDPRLIIDCGANIGMSTIYFAKKFKHATIVAIEPEQSNFELLKKNTSTYKNIQCIQKGIWHKDCSLKIINDHDYGHWGFRVVESSTEQGDIEATSIQNILSKYPDMEIDLLKIDIEGAELEIFSNNYETWLPRTNVIMIELHDWFRKGCSKAFFSALVKYDFSVYSRGENLICIRN
ncbi:MAG TPA: FkbM family methyltransferase [Flavobacteriales bacterium]|nr:FkbM family methyltransferase [Flavobacteriales bacterium]